MEKNMATSRSAECRPHFEKVDNQFIAGEEYSLDGL